MRDFTLERENMVSQQLRDIRDARVLSAMREVPRHLFVPAELLDRAYEDGPLPIAGGQTISQPYIVAYMTELLQIQPSDRVLEIGTGSGYQTAVLGKLAAQVYSVELKSELQENAKKILDSLKYRNLFFKTGDGWAGWPEFSPYDKMIVTAACDQVPEQLVRQLKEGGRMIFPYGKQDSHQSLIVGVKEHEVFKTAEKIAVRFVPLLH